MHTTDSWTVLHVWLADVWRISWGEHSLVSPLPYRYTSPVTVASLPYMCHHDVATCRLFYSRRVGLQVLHPEPVFILGQPRTGTTHLHNLLALDTERFAFATTFHAGVTGTA